MKPEQIYQELKDLAEKLALNVSDQNLRTAGIKVKSGMCKVKGKDMFIMDKHKSIHKKIKILVAQLADMPHENIYLIPAVRELLNKAVEKAKTKSEGWRSDGGSIWPSEGRISVIIIKSLHNISYQTLDK